MIIIHLIIGLFFLIQLFSWVSMLAYQPKEIQPRLSYPKVSILLAARNEEKLILRCLEAMSKLNYFIASLHVLVRKRKKQGQPSPENP